MQRDQLHDIVRRLDRMTDAQIAALTLPKEGLKIKTPLVIADRYEGATKLPPGPPNGLHVRADGSYEITRVAIVRVQPDEYRLLAKEMLKRATVRSLAIGAACGLAVAVGAIVAMQLTRNEPDTAAVAVSAPCLVSSTTESSVLCRLGQQAVPVAVGALFPDGQYRLDAVDPMRRSFTATRITDRQTILFQADLNLFPPNQE
ncbi:hypothetical protein [Massilia alkalitolerans]|uniref:hypothetical protein n=1 Tax=Massilia alkalitolerans TaxID=286638 RepID=UPI000485E9F0|nr:hypothetical protein [Massilia alkalitolerans]